MVGWKLAKIFKIRIKYYNSYINFIDLRHLFFFNVPVEWNSYGITKAELTCVPHIKLILWKTSKWIINLKTEIEIFFLDTVVMENAY